jgi:KaiC/GvpD/RAD55 family RecA-like ATPase
MIERVESGIPGLDELIEGGFVKSSINLIAGQTGTGKSILGCQFILHGLRGGERGVYLSLEQSEEEILGDVSRFGWDKELGQHIESGRLKMLSQTPTSIGELQQLSFDLIKRTGAKRFVLDSLSIATMAWRVSGMDVGKIRSDVFDYFRVLRKLDTTSLLIVEIPETEIRSLSRFGFEEFIADSVIILNYLEYAAGGVPRSLIIRKMRRTNHGTDVYPFEITGDGIRILSVKR